MLLRRQPTLDGVCKASTMYFLAIYRKGVLSPALAACRQPGWVLVMSSAAVLSPIEPRATCGYWSLNSFKEKKKCGFSIAVATIKSEQLKPKRFLLGPPTDDKKYRGEQRPSEPRIQDCGYLELGRAGAVPALPPSSYWLCVQILQPTVQSKMTLQEYFTKTKPCFWQEFP